MANGDQAAADSDSVQGWKSRKLWFAVFTSLLIFGGAVLCAYHPAIAAAYGEMSMGLLGALSIFSGANVFSSWATAKSGRGQQYGQNGSRYGSGYGGYGQNGRLYGNG